MSEVKKTKKTTKVVKEKETKKVAETKKETKVKSTSKKESVVKGVLTKKEKKTYTKLNKVIRILAAIVRIVLMVLVPFIVLAMILIPIVFNKFEISANVIKFGDASVIVRDTGLSFKIGEKMHVLDCNTTEVDRMMTFLSNHSKGTVIFSLELTLLVLTIITIFEIYLLSYIEKLFMNFEKGDTPFTKENTDYILIIAKFLIAVKVSIVVMSLIGIFNSCIASVGIFEILIAFVLYYVFKYATSMQKKVESKI